MGKPPRIIKANGDKVRFSRKRLFTSLLRSGASKDVANSVTDKVTAGIQSGVSTTQDIYATAYALLGKMKQRPVAGRYSLKKAIMQLGPTGFPFEQFFAEILKRQGYHVRTGVTIQGRCVSHEVDVVAVRGETHALIEAKFHNQSGIHTDVKVPLYIQARFQDIEAKLRQDGDTHRSHEPWVVTNTHFTSSAIQYGECMGMRLIGWRYPEDHGLVTLIEEAGLHPITCIPSLSQAQKHELLQQGITLCVDLLDHPVRLSQIGLSPQAAERVLREATTICQSV